MQTVFDRFRHFHPLVQWLHKLIIVSLNECLRRNDAQSSSFLHVFYLIKFVRVTLKAALILIIEYDSAVFCFEGG